MARKEASESKESHGFNDVLGIVLLSAAVLVLLAQLSYDPRDLSATTSNPNAHPRNWVGPIGANVALALFFVFGAGAYLASPLLIGFGLGCFLPVLAYLRKRWFWAVALVLAFIGMLDLYGAHMQSLTRNLNAPGAGGYIGLMMNKYLFRALGTAGATVVFFTIYLISFLYLTNFPLGEFIRAWWHDYKNKPKKAAEQEQALERRAKELEKKAAQLKDELRKEEDKRTPDERKTALGADLQPVPEPTVRDLSIPQSKADKRSKSKPAPAPEPEPADDLGEGEVISANEIAAATTEQILGRASEAKPKEDEKIEKAKAESKEEPAPVAAEVSAPVITDSTAAPPVEAAPPPPPAPKPRPAPKKPKPIAVASTPKIGNYQLPPMDFLQHADPNVKPTESKEELMANAKLMQGTLAQFGIEVALGDITKGPTITRYELHPAPGVKLEKITALSNNMAAALKAERIHILAPVPGKSSVGVEVPNAVKTKVIMRDLLESPEWHQTKARIPLALGKDVYGHPIIADLAEMPHLLIAGSTGSGKSVCINSIIASLLYRFSPDQLRFVMIDPKVVELQQYNALPHLVVPVVTDPKKVILALRWVVSEMEKRYQIFARVGVRNIKAFNERPKDKPLPQRELELPLTAKKEKVEANADGFAVELDEEIVVPRDEDIVIPEKLSYVVVIIDELADLMLVAPADVEMAIARITQMARAAGIHCIVATQRPSVDVITGVIKANIPARIAFQVASRVDSRTILDAMGADKLLGKGDMLYLPPGSAKLNRAQGVLITDQEIQSVVDHIAQQGKPSYEMEIHQQLQKPVSSFDGEGGGGSDEDEGLIEQCIEVIRSEQKASVSLLQRRLRLGYTRAARIMDELENRGIVGPSKGAEPRDILIDLDAGTPEEQGQSG
ncbi:MAG: DNA translocase FtsK [Verrucomicrobiota bacterium]